MLQVLERRDAQPALLSMAAVLLLVSPSRGWLEASPPGARRASSARMVLRAPSIVSGPPRAAVVPQLWLEPVRLEGQRPAALLTVPPGAFAPPSPPPLSRLFLFPLEPPRLLPRLPGPGSDCEPSRPLPHRWSWSASSSR
jgi:hypothetical protein